MQIVAHVLFKTLVSFCSGLSTYNNLTRNCFRCCTCCSTVVTSAHSASSSKFTINSSLYNSSWPLLALWNAHSWQSYSRLPKFVCSPRGEFLNRRLADNFLQRSFLTNSSCIALWGTSRCLCLQLSFLVVMLLLVCMIHYHSLFCVSNQLAHLLLWEVSSLS